MMNTHELLELAALDALGLLDDDERADFERGFQAAPPALQAQIRREQARMARADGLLPEIDPPASLRARVLAVVRDAIQTVGSRRSGSRFIPALLPSRGVSPIWRAAAVGSMAAAIVFGFATLRIRTEVVNINNLISSNAQEAEWVREYGPRFRDLIDNPNTKLVQFNTSGAANPALAKGRAVILVDSSDGSGLFLSRDLPPSANGYALVPLGSDGSLGQPILVIDANRGEKFNDRINNMAGAMAGATQFALIAQSRTGLDLANAVLIGKGT